ncbi:MAG: RnfABCDGE type electron transport complex subunit G [Thermodesulfobacteriota bacterium]|nr:RnfABCDGE type electron transport complex subunit G [Thermodesulfobacteriota bacterium]
MKEIIRLLVALTAVCMIAGLSLSYVNKITKEPRAYQDRLELVNALNMVLPDHDNEADKDFICVGKTKYYFSKAQGKINGVAFVCSTDKGYSGLIRVIAGVRPTGEIVGIGILEHKETPGLGSKIATRAFRDQYKGKSLDNAEWKVKKDGGGFDQISGATISPRAVTLAVKEGLMEFRANRSGIFGGHDVVQ